MLLANMVDLLYKMSLLLYVCCFYLDIKFGPSAVNWNCFEKFPMQIFLCFATSVLWLVCFGAINCALGQLILLWAKGLFLTFWQQFDYSVPVYGAFRHAYFIETFAGISSQWIMRCSMFCVIILACTCTTTTNLPTICQVFTTSGILFFLILFRGCRYRQHWEQQCPLFIPIMWCVARLLLSLHYCAHAVGINDFFEDLKHVSYSCCSGQLDKQYWWVRWDVD